MEVYIDNQKTNFGRRTKDLEKILKAISKKLEKNNKVIDLDSSIFGMTATFDYQKGLEELAKIFYAN